MRPGFLIAVGILVAVLGVTAAKAERPREETAFLMSETSAFLASKKVDTKSVREWVKQLRNIALLDSGCDIKAMVQSFQTEVPPRAFETVSDRMERFRKAFPLISSTNNPKGIYRCVVEFSRPKNDGTQRNNFQYNEYKNELDIRLDAASKWSEPYDNSHYIGQNSYGASAKVRRATFDWSRVEISSANPDGSKPATEYQYVGYGYTVRIKADRKEAAELESNLYVYGIVDLAYPYFKFEKSTDGATIKDPVEATFMKYDIYSRPRFIIVGDFFSKYLKVFDVSKCTDGPNDRGIISEQNCR
ncbi:hypothetical protein ACQKJ1_28015 [Methylorubrum rhodesianum]|uniref:hypothetical protein n=1 Tax=Methylorubrum rhodesianum TaxID=29427 RepID=UPI003D06DCC8